jgi:hypothetical protein
MYFGIWRRGDRMFLRSYMNLKLVRSNYAITFYFYFFIVCHQIALMVMRQGNASLCTAYGDWLTSVVLHVHLQNYCYFDMYFIAISKIKDQTKINLQYTRMLRIVLLFFFFFFLSCFY